VLAWVRGLDEEALLQPGHFAWTGRNALSTYVAANSCSHDRTASKILKRWRGGRLHWGGSPPESAA
jgi:hypothetical protein